MSTFLSLTEQQKKTLFAALSRKDVFTILSTGHGKYIVFQLLPDVCKYLSLRGYSYPRHAIIWLSVLSQGRNMMVYPGPIDPYFLAVILIPEPHFPKILIPEP